MKKKTNARTSLKPLIKWSGGKRSEIETLRQFYPKVIDTIVEPFSGGAAVSFDLNSDKIILNDVSGGLIDFYRTLQNAKTRKLFIKRLEAIDKSRKLVSNKIKKISDEDLKLMFIVRDKSKKNKENEKSKDQEEKECKSWLSANIDQIIELYPKDIQEILKLDIIESVHSKTQVRIPNLEKKQKKIFDNKKDHLETAINAGIYTTLRRLYNKEKATIGQVDQAWMSASWYVVRSLCYSGLFRYNKQGMFNVPYGGIGYNKRDFSSSIKQMGDKDLEDFWSRAEIHEKDFEALLDSTPNDKNTFIFLDPPYDSAFSQYNSHEDFTQKDHERLRTSLLSQKSSWMVVIKSTPFIVDLYKDNGFHIGSFSKIYQVNIKNRHDRDVEHLIITNYPLNNKNKLLKIIN